jgi:hypothetical protein
MKRIIGICIISFILVLAISGSSYAKFPNYTVFSKYLIDIKGWKSHIALPESTRWTSPPDAVHPTGEDGLIIRKDYNSEKPNMGWWQAEIKVIDCGPMLAEAGYHTILSQQNVDTLDIKQTTKMISGHTVVISYDKTAQPAPQCNITVVLNVKKKNTVYAVFYIGTFGITQKDALELAQKFPWTDIEKEIDKY